jgi:F0F1-type ATP synthase membrane subunit a
MDGAVLLGSIAMRFVVDAPARRLVFMELMREAVADMLEEQLGSRPQWCGPEVAPESERAGHG